MTIFKKNKKKIECKNEKVLDVAKRTGYQTAEFISEWKGYSVYRLTFFDNKPRTMGLPVFVLEKEDEEPRLSTSEEAFEFIHSKQKH